MLNYILFLFSKDDERFGFQIVVNVQKNRSINLLAGCLSLKISWKTQQKRNWMSSIFRIWVEVVKPQCRIDQSKSYLFSFKEYFEGHQHRLVMVNGIKINVILRCVLDLV